MRTRTKACCAGMLALVLGSTAALPSPVLAAQPVVARVEVSTPGAPRSPELSRELAAAIRREVRALGLGASSSEGGYVLSAALTGYAAQRQGESISASCAVSITLRDRRDGNLVVLLSGRATAEDQAHRSDFARRVALEAAVRSALRRLPSSLP